MKNNEHNGQKIKFQILNIIKEIIQLNHWNQMTAAKILGVDQPKISQIINGKTAGFSLERLLTFLLKLNCKIDLSISTQNNSGLIHENQSKDNLDYINLIILPQENL
ncbi:XRE family transcriptional regulator [Neoehrlichia mikurensis]|uniref:Helix-turn-helix domain-containing protein n=1 Tax=Neoehrlichia mikurensis TaxID=89586 RepID=A0A9Q9BYQ4_9RICK|nr:XRE family transcriptional regulator [Neoehrlichia mikurensis]QXK92077.1 XRE family transcriptional regulator [Neoehrlichia mikurensis]QXK92534.1 XRE family transcriptional regulator [Neoehrlichia mikurensis]QXK93770.1 XRE family transcriptional regulator [Neoehrlichia mikurensis]UTO55254.1 helix-turn-helix domain-containing protein [Neoehrlichia mikurensis]UTO56175.1 helix-turn-helix domain-containing protein [Neoehrlichia mikurensis]